MLFLCQTLSHAPCSHVTMMIRKAHGLSPFTDLPPTTRISTRNHYPMSNICGARCPTDACMHCQIPGHLDRHPPHTRHIYMYSL